KSCRMSFRLVLLSAHSVPLHFQQLHITPSSGEVTSASRAILQVSCRVDPLFSYSGLLCQARFCDCWGEKPWDTQNPRVSQRTEPSSRERAVGGKFRECYVSSC